MLLCKFEIYKTSVINTYVLKLIRRTGMLYCYQIKKSYLIKKICYISFKMEKKNSLQKFSIH